MIQNQYPFVKLRAMEPEDLDILYQIENDFSLWNVGSTNVPYSRYMLHDYIANASNDIYSDKQVRFMAVDESGEVVGIADLVNFNPQHSRAEIGLVVVKGRQEHGYGHAIVKKMICYCKNVLHLHQIYGIISVDNKKSLSLFNSMGFNEVMRLPEWLCAADEYHDAVVVQSFL